MLNAELSSFSTKLMPTQARKGGLIGTGRSCKGAVPNPHPALKRRGGHLLRETPPADRIGNSILLSLFGRFLLLRGLLSLLLPLLIGVLGTLVAHCECLLSVDSAEGP